MGGSWAMRLVKQQWQRDLGGVRVRSRVGAVVRWLMRDRSSSLSLLSLLALSLSLRVSDSGKSFEGKRNV